jgi:hypothetical protein
MRLPIRPPAPNTAIFILVINVIKAVNVLKRLKVKENSKRAESYYLTLISKIV